MEFNSHTLQDCCCSPMLEWILKTGCLKHLCSTVPKDTLFNFTWKINILASESISYDALAYLKVKDSLPMESTCNFNRTSMSLTNVPDMGFGQALRYSLASCYFREI